MYLILKKQVSKNAVYIPVTYRGVSASQAPLGTCPDQLTATKRLIALALIRCFKKRLSYECIHDTIKQIRTHIGERDEAENWFK